MRDNKHKGANCAPNIKRGMDEEFVPEEESSEEEEDEEEQEEAGGVDEEAGEFFWFLIAIALLQRYLQPKGKPRPRPP